MAISETKFWPTKVPLWSPKKQTTEKSHHPTMLWTLYILHSPYSPGSNLWSTEAQLFCTRSITETTIITHCHVGSCTNERVDVRLHRADKSTADAKVAQFYLTTRIHENIWWLYICTVTASLSIMSHIISSQAVLLWHLSTLKANQITDCL